MSAKLFVPTLRVLGQCHEPKTSRMWVRSQSRLLKDPFRLLQQTARRLAGVPRRGKFE